MIIPIELSFKADKDTRLAVSTNKTIKSHDINSVEFHIAIEGLELTNNHTAKILSIFHSSKSQVNTDCEIVDGKIIYKPDTKLISMYETVTNYVYVYHNNQSVDVCEFNYTVKLSKIDETSLEVKEVYDKSYADLLTNFEQALSDYKDSLPQADSVRADIDEILNQFNVDSQSAIGYLEEVSASAEIAERARKDAELLREENYNQKVDTAIVEADVVAKVDNKVTELTPQINNLTAQLAQKINKGEVSVYDIDKNKGKFDQTYMSEELLQQMAGDTPINAVPADKSITTHKIADKAVTSKKRTVLGNLPLIIIGSSGVIPNYNTSTKTLEMNSAIFIVVGKTRYQIPSDTLIDCSEVLSKVISCVVVFDTNTNLLRVIPSPNLSVVSENEVVIATIAYSKYLIDLLDINMNCKMTIDGQDKDVFLLKTKITSSLIDNNAITSDKRTSLGELPLITKGQSGGLINFDTASRMLVFDVVSFIFHRNNRYTIPSGTVVDFSSLTTTAGIVIYYDLETGKFYPKAQTKLTGITETSIMIAVVYESSNKWNMLMNADYVIDGKPKFMPYGETIEVGTLPYQFSVEKLTGDFPESDLAGVGEVGNPFDRTNDDYNLVYSLFDNLMTDNPNYITREEIGRSTNNVPIYCYHFTPEIAPVIAGSLLKPYPKILMDSSIHGGENLGTDTLYFLFKRICEDWQTDKGLEYLRHYVNFSIVPLPNPEDYTNKQYIGIDGVNLNRDFDYNWKQQEGAGTTAFSRVESQVMRDFFIANDDALLFVNIHVRGSKVENDNQTMWMGSSDIRETPILANTIEKMTRKWKQKYPALQNVDGQLGYITIKDASGTIKSYAHRIVGIPSILWEGFKATPTMNEFEGKDVVNMNVQFLGETVFNIIKRKQD